MEKIDLDFDGSINQYLNDQLNKNTDGKLKKNIFVALICAFCYTVANIFGI